MSSPVCPQPALDAALAARALDLAAPSIERLLAEPKVRGEGLLHVVVLQPWFDEAACNIVVALLRGLVLERVRATTEEEPD